MASKPQFTVNEAPSSSLPTRLHHHGYVCEDQERTRHFYEDILGLPLLAAWVEEADFQDFPGQKSIFSHAFYGIGDGGALAFFQFADPKVQAHYKAAKNSMFVHIALAISGQGQETPEAASHRSQGLWLGERSRVLQIHLCLRSGRTAVGIHGRPANVEDINTHQRKTAHETLRRWQAGDRTLNNEIRPH